MSTGTMPTFNTKANSSDGGDFEHPPAGTHPAILVALIDLGTTDSTFKGETKKRHKIHLTWELTAEADSNGQNFLIAQDYTWSLNAKAGLRKIVEGFRGKAMADNEEFDIMAMLGKPSMVNISEGLSGAGKKFMEVVSVSPPMRGLTVPPATHDVFAFHLGFISSGKDLAIPAWIPRLYGRLVADDIEKSDEFGQIPPF